MPSHALGSHVFQLNGAIFKSSPESRYYKNTSYYFKIGLICDFLSVNKVSLLPYKENCPTAYMYFDEPVTIKFQHSTDVIRTNVLIEFHEDWTINVTINVYLRFNL
ncbi:hypothetical protein DPMN_145352 [Dreissena polymorpha]|uniref:Uncharacterized protein n=1 Tax=Dreissena polymorpha TaxID=45954 RepID=A0A9D4F883_DREPO|nr:hypothetical protein DPMN_145352 [Dreissena polymorpha]